MAEKKYLHEYGGWLPDTVVAHTCHWGYELPTISLNTPLRVEDYKSLSNADQL